MSSPLAGILQPLRLTEVVDIGANPIDGEPPYKPMLTAGLCKVTGFEPQQEALTRLQQAKGPNERYLPHAIGDGGRHTLQVCRYSGMTSLLEPDMTTMDLFPVFKRLGEVIARVPIDTRRLDAIDEIVDIDFLKMDVQGTELTILRHGREKLKHAIAVQAEVSFVTLYQGQPGVGEVDVEMRSQGFMPHCFAALKRWPISPCVINNDPNAPLNQLLEADLVYVRDISRPDAMTDEQLKHLALIAHHCYRSFDLAIRCIVLLEQRRALPAGAHASYLQTLNKP